MVGRIKRNINCCSIPKPRCFRGIYNISTLSLKSERIWSIFKISEIDAYYIYSLSTKPRRFENGRELY